jgi:L-lactate utilization protein LutC
MLAPEMTFSEVASNEQIQRTAKALEANGIRTIIAANAEEAKKALLDLIPEGAEVFTSTSQTLEALGVLPQIDERYDSIRVRLAAMNPATQMREMIKMGAVPEYMIGSVHAVTEDGSVVVASKTGSQLAGYVAAAANVIWVVGAQKIVANLDEAMRRVEEYSLPLEDARALQAYGVNSNISKLLIIHKEENPKRTTMIIVKDQLGF